jgi:hypothetical protein
MAVTQNTYTGNGSTTNYSFTFPYLEETDIKVTLGGVLTTAYTLANATTVSFTSAPGNGVAIRIYRETNADTPQATFFAGSAIRAQDLNDNFSQVLYNTQETVDRRLDSTGGTMSGQLDMGNNKIVNLGTPTNNADASTKAYVDSTIGTAGGYAAAAASSASAAATSASNASTSATNSATSASASATSAAASLASQTAAAASQSAAASSASTASTQASNAATSASNASTSATNASNSATSAASSAASALAAFDSFDDRYLGAKASDPSVDNDGDPLNAGDLYYNTTSSVMKVYTGSVWVVAYVPGDAVNISFTPYGNISSTNVQNAIQEVVDELAPDKISEGNSSVEVVDTGTGKVVFTVDGGQISEITATGGYRATGSDVTRLSSNVMVSQLNSTGVTLGVYGGTNKSELRFLGNTVSDWVGFKAPSSLSSAIIWTLPNADGTSGQALKTNGSGTLSWGTAGGASGAGGDDVFYENGQTVTTSYTLTAGKNAMSAGPITINAGAVITVPSNASWVVL